MEEGFYGADGFLEGFVQGVDGRAVGPGGGRDCGDIVGYEVC